MIELSYSLVQYVGDPVRREALNIGVVVSDRNKGSIVRVDLRAHARISAAWPDLDHNLFFAFVRDLRHALAATHQLYLAEAAIHAEGPSSALGSLSDRMANQFRLTEPRTYTAENARVAADALFKRMVVPDRENRSRRPRYMTRAELRTHIGEVLGLWLGAREEVRGALVPYAELEGAVARHRVDLATYTSEETPEMLFFAAPLSGQQAPLIRDAIPTIVADLKARMPSTEFFAILGERGPNNDGQAEQVARAILGQVPELKVLSLAQLRDTFRMPGLAAAS